MGRQRMVKPNGKMPISLGWAGGFQSFEIAGGPFDAFEAGPNRVGVCVRAERPSPDAGLNLPIPDFGVPERTIDVEYVLKRTLYYALMGREVYVGCMGGFGRTGMFLALLAKACGVEDPVSYVRRTYHRRAVETMQQERYVADFDVTGVRTWLFWAGWQKRWLNWVFCWKAM